MISYSIIPHIQHSLVTFMVNESDFCGGCLVIQGTVMAALHVYLPPSEEKTGLKERVRVERVPCVCTSPTVLFPSLPTTLPSGPTHSIHTGKFIPDIGVTMHTKEWFVFSVANLAKEWLTSTVAQSSGTKEDRV